MSLGPLAQSADKSVLMKRLGLNDRTHRLLLVSFTPNRYHLLANPAVVVGRGRARKGCYERAPAQPDRPVPSRSRCRSALQVG